MEISSLGQPAPIWCALVLEKQTGMSYTYLTAAKAYTLPSVGCKASLKGHPISSSQLVKEVGRYIISP